MKQLYITTQNNESKLYEINNDTTLSLINSLASLSTENLINTNPNTKLYQIIEHKNFSFWEKIHQSHNPIDWIEIISKEDTIFLQFDEILEKILCYTAIPQIENRNNQEGITLLFEINNHLFAFLVFQNNIYGVFEHNLTQLTPQLLQKNLEEFRFGWLPNEEVLKQNGYGCILKNIPAEAEGFRPIYIIDEKNTKNPLFQQIGKIITEVPNSIEIITQIHR